MAKVDLEVFGGMIPAVDDRLLPQNAAAEAINTWVYDGKLTGMREPKLVYTLADPATRSVFRIPQAGNLAENISSSVWVEFLTHEMTYVRTPVREVTDPTYYYSDGFNPPRYNTQSRIEAGDVDYILGVPAPSSPITIVHSGGVSATNDTRSYVFTHVSFMGEEGPPSPPSAVTTGKIDDTWALTIPAVGLDAVDRNLTHTNIYRTITNDQGQAEYYFVAQVPIATLLYNDVTLSDVVVLNDKLISQFFDPPPINLKCMRAMPNGMVVGFVDNEIWFCEPYRPHAWPAPYQIAVDYPIVGIGVFDQTAIICTANNPYNCTGAHPSVMSLRRINALNEPCVSFASIVSAPEGVYYSSQSGLVLVGPGVQAVATESLISKKRWQQIVNISRLSAAMLGKAYYCFSGVGEGCFQDNAFQNDAFEITDFTGTKDGALIDLKDVRVALNRLRFDTSVYNVLLDPWSNEVLIIKDGGVYLIDTTDGSLEGSYLWRSKVFRMDRITNIGVGKLYYELPVGVVGPTITLRVYGDGALLHTEVDPASGAEFRLPAGERYDFYQFEVEGEKLITAMQFATSAKELRGNGV